MYTLDSELVQLVAVAFSLGVGVWVPQVGTDNISTGRQAGVKLKQGVGLLGCMPIVWKLRTVDSKSLHVGTC